MPDTNIRSAIQLSTGDRIVGPDGAIHTVTAVDHYDLGQGITEIDTDTGIHLRKMGWQRREPAYDVVV